MGEPAARLVGAARRLRDGEQGSAVIEFVFLGVVLLVPLAYLIITASQVQAASYAAVGAADHAAKVFVGAPDEATARARAQDAAARGASAMGLPASSATLSYSCSGPCLEPGTTVTVEVEVAIELPLLPPGVNAGIGSASATATHRVERFG
ncbi:hypothetical protein ACQ7DA_13460 [Zafaria sp. J156]|uniref:hypothetical protein n=1 Tax=Zafaria sp. J156 TaxID=3116490 RepID=UPI002E788BF9|nr:hypothetical protein [Zafaria sp. J156]MEE1622172.1 hypothetical protein [Zafaria sp. J156]